LCNSCASLAGLVSCFIACFILLVIAPKDVAIQAVIVPRGPNRRRRRPNQHV